MREFYAIFMYELKKILGDKKMLISIVVFPIIGFLVSSVAGILESEFQETGSYNIYIVGKKVEKQTIAYTDDIQIVITAVNEDNIRQVKESKYYKTDDVIVEFNKNKATVYYKSTEEMSLTLCSIAKSIIEEINKDEFINKYSISEVKEVKTSNLGEGKGISNIMVSIFLPYMLILFLSTSVFSYASETISGEKEKGVFEKNLLAPVSAKVIIGAKVVSSISIGFISSVVYVGVHIIGTLLFETYGNSNPLGLSGTKITIIEASSLVVYILLLCYLFSIVAVLCSLYAKNLKEAKAMLMPIMGIAMFVSLMSMLRTGTVVSEMYYLPLYNICIIIQDILNGIAEFDNIIRVAMSLGMCAVIISVFTIKSFDKESIRC